MSRSLVLAALVLTGCGPVLVTGNFPNPARSTDKLTATQTYELGPYKENHQYELTLQDWTASSISLGIKLTDVDHCGEPATYAYTLVDDHGGKSVAHLDEDKSSTPQTGKANVKLVVTTQTGVFPIAITPNTTSVTVQMRPQGAACPSIDYRFTLQ
jgi:hypothetical protein